MPGYGDFLMIFSENLLLLGYIDMEIARKGVGKGWVMAKAKKRNKTTHMAEFRVAVTFTCTHKGPII